MANNEISINYEAVNSLATLIKQNGQDLADKASGIADVECDARLDVTDEIAEIGKER